MTAESATEPLDLDRAELRSAVGGVLCNAMNFPEAVQARLLGQDMAPLMGAVTDAVLAAGFHHSQADVPALLAEVRRLRAVVVMADNDNCGCLGALDVN